MPSKYILTIEYLINENTNIKKIDDKIENFMKINNGLLHKTDIIYNTNKRYKKLSKTIMFNNYILHFNKISDLKKFITNIFKYINNFDKTNPDIKPVNITKYCSKNTSINNKDISKYENNILITNLTKLFIKNNKEQNESIFDIKKYDTNTIPKVSGGSILTNIQTVDKEDKEDSIIILQKDIINYYKQNNIIN